MPGGWGVSSGCVELKCVESGLECCAKAVQVTADAAEISAKVGVAAFAVSVQCA